MPKVAIVECINKCFDDYATYSFNIQDSDWVEISEEDLRVLSRYLKNINDRYELVVQKPKTKVLELLNTAVQQEAAEAAKKLAEAQKEAARKQKAAAKRAEAERQKILKKLNENPEWFNKFVGTPK